MPFAERYGLYSMNIIAKEKILPVKYPMVTSFTYHADLFAVLETKEETKDWIYSNHILLTSERYRRSFGEFVGFEFHPSMSCFLVCPWIKPQIMSREFIRTKYSCVREFFIDVLNQKSYIYVMINEEHIIRKLTGQEMGRVCHPLFIYGYDLTQNIFYIADFLFRNNKYSFEEADIDDVCQGYEEVMGHEDATIHERGGVFLLNYKGSNDDPNYRYDVYKFDTYLVKKSFEYYLEGRPGDYTLPMHTFATGSTIPLDKCRLGVDSYSYLYENLELVLEDRQGILSNTAPHVIYDHKVLMLHRIEYMLLNGYLETDISIIDEIKEIQDKSLALRNQHLKFRVTNNKKTLLRIIDGYKWIEEKERKLYPRILTGLVEK